MITALARFRANPKKIRVSLLRRSVDWIVTVAERSGNLRVQRTGTTPEAATDEALQAARSIAMAGIDLTMDWAYPHPQHHDDEETTP